MRVPSCGEGLELNIRASCPFDEMLAFVNEVATSCFLRTALTLLK